jgi:hypothetical protein
MGDAHHHLVLEQPERCAVLIDELASGMLQGPT